MGAYINCDPDGSRAALAARKAMSHLTHVAVIRSGHLFALRAPHSHKDVLALMKANGVKKGEATEGYLDEYCNFLDKHAAAVRVQHNDQELHDESGRHLWELPSSVLWHTPRTPKTEAA